MFLRPSKSKAYHIFDYTNFLNNRKDFIISQYVDM